MLDFIIGFLLGFQTAGMLSVVLLYGILGWYGQRIPQMMFDAMFWPIFLWVLFRRD